jgi:GH25 family lysozyme M1 (1,4-beta-N-acetylmuramidase)
MKGADFSKHNPIIDWNKVDDSIQFGLFRAGYGNDISQKDPKFDEYVRAALAHKLHVGAYWFSYAVSIADVLKEAEVFKKVLAPYKGKLDFPVAFDYEYDSINWAVSHKITVAASADAMARAFMESMKADGWFVNLYTNIDFIKSGRFSSSTISKYDVWLADYNGAPDYPCYIQQTTDKGAVPGVTGRVDLDVSFRDYPIMIKAGGYNGYKKQTITGVEIDTTMDVTFRAGRAYVFRTKSEQTPAVICGTQNVVRLERVLRNDYEKTDYWKLTFIGKPGQATGIYTAIPGEHPLKRFIARVA